MTTDFSNVFHAFVEAEKAMIELPKLRADLTAANTTIAEHADHIDELNLDLEHERNTITRLTRRVIELEAALADATFRGKADHDMVEALRRMLGLGGGDGGAVQPAMSETEAPYTETEAEYTTSEVSEAPALGEFGPVPVPADVSSPTPSSVSATWTDAAPPATATSTNDTVVASSSSGQSAADPIASSTEQSSQPDASSPLADTPANAPSPTLDTDEPISTDQWVALEDAMTSAIHTWASRDTQQQTPAFT